MLNVYKFKSFEDDEGAAGPSGADEPEKVSSSVRARRLVDRDL